jgi:hypothetical protein
VVGRKGTQIIIIININNNGTSSRSEADRLESPPSPSVNCWRRDGQR